MAGARSEGRRAGLVAGAALAGTGLLMAWSTAGMQVPPTYAKVGPQVFPFIAAAILIAAGLWFAWRAWAGGEDRLRPDVERPDWMAVGMISAGFLVEILFIELLGFILASAALFFAVAWGFGSRRPVYNALWALALSTAAYFVFTRLLNLQLPAGVHKGWF